ncbi:MAG: LarC family nickel insertion protein [Chloroflexota bacterium]|nr:LarC family nickel insertion protein [Chloroflexota bacterium]MDQ5867130.1 LarC family nickel insertion protein [Chloroflexota bacterium]
MRVAFFDPVSGLSAEMILGALVDVGVPVESLRAELYKLPLASYSFDMVKALRQGVTGTYLEVGTGPGSLNGVAQLTGRLGRYTVATQPDTSLEVAAMLRMILGSSLPAAVQQGAVKVLRKLAEIECEFASLPQHNGKSANLWNVETLVQVVGTMSALNMLGVNRVDCAAFGVGCDYDSLPSHERLGIALLRRTPRACDENKLDRGYVTLTGAAIMVSIVTTFGTIPTMRIDGVGYGATSTSEPGRAGLIRVLVGETTARPTDESQTTLPLRLTPTNGHDPASPADTLIVGSHQQSGRHRLLKRET